MASRERADRNDRGYKRFIDELVGIAQVEVTAKRIRDRGHAEHPDDKHVLSDYERERKQFLLGMSEEHREMLAEMLEDSYRSAIHDVASFLEWATSCDDLKMEWKGEAISASPFSTMHHDFVGRLAGDPWLDEKDEDNGAK
jgi:hypothetical protein